ncbi:MAG: aminoglycoside phosphotransferase family protein [Clostridia bacterium]|nr:aminoglycoside phosphotransferase family protein [Clostridia bacterium]
MKNINIDISIANNFFIKGKPISINQHGNGHINNTTIITTDQNIKYILQRINDAFDVNKLMDNINAITSFLALKSDSPDRQMKLIHTIDDKNYYSDATGNYRMFSFVEDSICLDAPKDENDFYQSALAFGEFQKLLEDFPAKTLFEPIKDFHNTPNRYKLLKEAISKNLSGRADFVKEEIDFALQREEFAGTLEKLKNDGELPIRVTHNDTKLNNVLFDKNDRKAICVIDLDTVMPGLSLYDFGDAIRFGASTSSEDEHDLSKVTIDLGMFRAFTKGYINSCNLTDNELKYLVHGAIIITLECGVRFLTDYIDGDLYFKTTYDEQNLARCRTQFKLVSEMEKNFDKLQQIVKEECKK